MQELVAVDGAVRILIDLADEFVDHVLVEVLPQRCHEQSEFLRSRGTYFFGHDVVSVLVELLEDCPELLLVLWAEFVGHFRL
jgi:hypothetical protein